MSIDLNIPLELPPPPPPPEVAPIIKFPPFPPVPEGVTIIPFGDFKPSGIKKFLDPSPDAIELDGTGVPTAQLKVKHASPDSEKWKKKKKKMGEGDDGVIRKYTWWEEWERDEANRKIVQMIDPDATDADRLIQATHDFRSGRPWPPITTGLQYLFDAFRLYVGLLSQPIPPHRKKRTRADNADPSDEEDVEGDEELNPIDFDPKGRDTKPYLVEEPQVGQKPIPPDAADDEDAEWLAERAKRIEDAEEQREARTRDFLNNPETHIAIFLSSHYRDKGLIWSEGRCRDGPILLMFFISFLLRNKVFPDPSFEKELKKALEVVAIAKKELPASFGIGKSLPDVFSSGCATLWGSKIETLLVSAISMEVEKPDGGEESESKRQKVEDPVDPEAAEVAAEIEKQIIDFDEVTASVPAGWGSAEDLESVPGGGWGGQSLSGWGESSDQSPWDMGATWDTADIPSVMKILGPTSLPLSHTTGVVEFSTRKISAILSPQPRSGSPNNIAEAVEWDLEGRLGRMVMAPWIGWDKHEKSDVTRPVIMPKSRGKVVRGEDEDETMDGEDPGHDPSKDEITVLVEPSVLGELIVGMGIGATWIQIARADEDGNPVSAPDMWYLEQLIQIIPSYHIDP